MKKRLLYLALMLVLFASMFATVTMTASAATAPTKMWVAPSDTNGIPVQIDVFKAKTGGNYWNPTYSYQLFLPGNVDPANCFLSWDGDMKATVGSATYDSGSCPVPTLNTETTYTFKNGSQTAATFKLTAYQGSAAVQPIFIDIDESQGTIAAMDGDTTHETSCSGRVNIAGQWYDMPKIKGRGNVTWSLASDKRPYNITLGTKINFPGIDSPATKKWTILAEILDHSLLCNRSGFHLAHEIGVGQDTASADVWMNGEYQGCYTITPKTDSFVTKTGFMIEEDNYLEGVENGGDPQFPLTGLNEASGWSSCYNRITVKKIGDSLLTVDGVLDESPENQDAVAQGTIKPWLQDAWDAIRSADGYNSKGKYYTDYIDIESFAKMYLMHEYVKSYDVCAGSILFYRNGNTDNDKLFAGPLWDLDNAMGSTYRNSSLGKADDRTNGDRRSGEGSFIANVTEYKTSIYKTLSKHSDFMEEVELQYNKNKAAFDSLPDDVAKMISDIRDSAMMNHIKVNEITGSGSTNNHKYSKATTLGSGQYQQSFLATTDSKSDWPNYAANLKTYITARTLWFGNTYYDPNYVDPATCEHQYEAVVTPPTCTAEGYTTYTCPLCKTTFVDDVTPMIAHDYQDGVCTVCGQILRTVTFACDEGASVTVYETQSLDSDCIENAVSVHPRDSETGLIDCSGSGQVNFVVNLQPGYELVNVTAEPAGSFKNLKPPADTGIVNGYRLTKVTGDPTITVTTSRVDPGTCEHEYAAVVTPPTCLTEGYTTYTCPKCAHSYVGDTVPVIPHDYQNGVCTVCGQTLLNVAIVCSDGASVTVYETQDITGSGEVDPESVHPRNGDTGLIDCSGSGQVNFVVNLQPGYELVSVEAAPAESYKNLKLPADTGIANGYRVTKVSGDLTITVTAINRDPATCEHEFTAVVTPPTCTAEGYTTHTCGKCGYSYTDEATPIVAHDYQNGVCTVCGQTLLTATFDCSEGASVTVYETQSLNSACEENAVTAHPRNSVTGLIDCSGSGQINFVVNVADGYALSSVSAEPAGAYKNLKLPADTGVANGYRLTKITGDLTVTVRAHKALSITKQPVDYTGAAGSTIRFTTAASGEGLTYQWYFKRTGEEEFQPSTLASGKKATFLMNMAEKYDGWQYYCVVTDDYGATARSNTVTIHLAPPLVITDQPVDYTGRVGSVVKFTVAAQGEGLTYQWWYKKTDSDSFVRSTLASGKKATYSLTLAERHDGWQYYCVVKDTYGQTARSDTVTIHLAPPIVITDQPVDYTGCVGSAVKFTVAASGEGLTYQWWYKKTDSDSFVRSTLASGKKATYSLTLAERHDGWQYYCVVKDTYGQTARSDTVTIHIVAPPLAITVQPQDYTGAAGSTIKFKVVAQGEGLTYQWYFKRTGEDSFHPSTLASGKKATYTMKMADKYDGWQYYCIITDANGDTVQTNTVTVIKE